MIILRLNCSSLAWSTKCDTIKSSVKEALERSFLKMFLLCTILLIQNIAFTYCEEENILGKIQSGKYISPIYPIIRCVPTTF